jgi:hypothetical protein
VGSRSDEDVCIFSICLILPAALRLCGLPRPLTEMSTRNLKDGRPERKADNLAANSFLENRLIDGGEAF